MEELLKNAEKAARRGDYAAAEKHCREYLVLAPSDKEGLRLLAFIHALDRCHDKAIATVTEVILLGEKEPEPSDYMDRGRWKLESQDFIGACADFSEVVSLCGRYDDGYYLESAYMHRAVALARQGAISPAQKDLECVSDDCEVFVLGELVSKHVLLERLHSRGE